MNSKSIGYDVKVTLGVDETKSKNNINQALTKIESQVKKMDIEFDVNSAQLTKVSESAKKMTMSFKDANGTVASLTKDINKGFEDGVVAVNKQVKANEKLSYSWTRAWEGAVKYSLVMGSLVYAQRAIGAMVQSVIDLDDSLTQLQKVTDLEGSSLEQFTKDAYAAGEGLAKTGKEVIDASTSFAQAGYDSDASLQLGQVALMYQNIADEEIAAGDAADFIIAQLKAFKLEADDMNKTLENSYHVIDSVNEVSNKFAVSSSDIATNLGISSSVMANAGNTLEESIGLLTAGTEITRSANRVSNGLKTITLRLQGMNDEGEESLEVQAQMEELFNKLGLTVYDSNGQIKNTFNLLKDLSEVYPNLTAAEKAYVTETIAG